MKVYIGPYKRWFGPYQLAELLMFWVPKEKDEFGFYHTADRVHKFGEWLAYGSVKPEPEVGELTTWEEDRKPTLINRFLSFIDNLKIRIEYVKIDKYDTWSMDHTLAHIILPMLKQLKATKHGSQIVDLEDVPEYLRTTTTEDYEDQLTFDFYQEEQKEKIGYDIHDRWDWVMDEMIFAFESYFNNWDDKYHTGEHDIQWKKLDDGTSQMVHGPNNTHRFDVDGWEKESKRIANGFRLFGKYYKGLWD